MPSFSMRPAKYFYDKPFPKYLDPKTVLIYCTNIARTANVRTRHFTPYVYRLSDNLRKVYIHKLHYTVVYKAVFSTYV
jgi:hypothetical protein